MGLGKLYNTKGTHENNTFDFLIERAKGGVGLIVTRYVGVKPLGLEYNLYDKKQLFEPLADLTAGVHRYGAKILMQLSAGPGRTLHRTPASCLAAGVDPNKFFFAPSDDTPNYWYPDVKHRSMTIGEIQAITESFIRMAEIARDTGFDGVEVHAIHEGYLLDQFTIECTNMRKDEYGGSLENRMRLPREIIEGIKHACGRDFVVSVRYSVVSKMKGFNSGALPGEYYTEFGRSLEQSPSVARILEAAGCDVLNADNGSYDAWYWAHPPVYMPEACNLPEAAYIKNFLNIPVLCAGRMDNPDRALLAVQSGQIDGIGLARALLADPYYVEKVREGRVSDIRPCIACHSVCLNMELHASGGCAVNPTVLHEREYEAQNSMKVTKAKKVAVIGGNSRDGSRM